MTNGPPPNWPQNPSLSFSRHSETACSAPDYASGTLNPGASVTVKLSKPGIYLIGCAFHYIEFSMRDVIQVVASATPGPTASPGPGAYTTRAAKPRPHAASRGRATPTASGRPAADTPLRSHRCAESRSIVTFVSAHCTDACPLINAQFARRGAANRSALISTARLLTITLDPEHDSPQTMRELAQRFDANPRYWLLAGGSIRDVHAVMRAFGVISEKADTVIATSTRPSSTSQLATARSRKRCLPRAR